MDNGSDIDLCSMHYVFQRITLVCLHAGDLSRSWGQSLSNVITSFFSSFVSSYMPLQRRCLFECSETPEQQSDILNILFLPSQIAKVSKLVTVTLSWGCFLHHETSQTLLAGSFTHLGILSMVASGHGVWICACL